MENDNIYSNHPEVLIPIAEYVAEILFNELAYQTPDRSKGKIIFSNGETDQREYTYCSTFAMDISDSEVSINIKLGDRKFDEIVAKYSKINHSNIAAFKRAKIGYIHLYDSFLLEILFESLGMQRLPARNESDFCEFSDAITPYLKREILKKPISLYGIQEVDVYFRHDDEYWDDDGYRIKESNKCIIRFIKKEVIEEPSTPESQAEYRKSKLKSW